MPVTNFSQKILETIKNLISVSQTPAEVLSDLLNISTDAAYRRLSGKVDLTLDEAACLCTRFNISLDLITTFNNRKISFDYFALFNEHFKASYAEYLTALESSLREVMLGNGNIYVSAADIPIGFLMRYPSLMAFKLYCWRNDMVGTNLQVPFTLQTEQNPYSDYFERFPVLYQQANSSEVWSRQTFSGFIEALIFYKEMELIPAEALSVLTNNLHTLFNDAESFASESRKESGGTFALYISPLTLANSIFLLERGNIMTSFLKMYAINSIWTSNELYCSEQKRWFEALINSSTAISGGNPKERKKYFSDMHAQIEGI